MKSDTDAEIDRMIPVLFDDFELYDGVDKTRLERKIIKHYFFNELGFETWGQFRWRFNTKLQEIMPYFNERYKSLTLKYDPMNPTNIGHDQATNADTKNNTTGNAKSKSNGVGDTTNHATSDGTSADTSSSNGENKYWDTPQTELSEDGLSYATNLTRDKNSGQSNGTTHNESNQTGHSTTENTSNTDTKSDFTGNAKSQAISHDIGNSGIPGQDLLQKYRDVIVNIDLEIIEALRPLFMEVY